MKGEDDDEDDEVEEDFGRIRLGSPREEVVARLSEAEAGALLESLHHAHHEASHSSMLEYLLFEEQARCSAAERHSHIGLEVQRVLPLFSSQMRAAHASHGKKLEKVSRTLENLEILALNSGQRDSQTQQILAGIINGLPQPYLVSSPLQGLQEPLQPAAGRPMLSLLRAVPTLTCRSLAVSLPRICPQNIPYPLQRLRHTPRRVLRQSHPAPCRAR